MNDFNLAIVGSGFGGSVLAMIARRLGLRVMLLERGRHPRFAIGESASPLAGVLIEQLADRYDLPRLRPLSAYGTWQRSYPEVGCGLKRGFTYFKHEPGRAYRAEADRSNQLLVAASPSDELSDTHWLRSDVDHFLVREAVALGVEYLDGVSLAAVEWHTDGTPVLTGRRGSEPLRLHADFVVDASGPHGSLARALNIADRGFNGYPSTQALFSHFTGVARCEDMDAYNAGSVRRPACAHASARSRQSSLLGHVAGGSGCDGAKGPVREPGVRAWEGARVQAPESAEVRGEEPPYPMDHAALHHVFDGGWMWVLRFGNGVTSAGVAVTDALAADLQLADGAPAWRRLLERYPSIQAQFADARPIREFTWMPRLAYRAAVAAGARWAMLPSAAAFVDPLFSTGIPLTLLGIERIAQMLEVGPAALDKASASAKASADTSAPRQDPTQWEAYNHITLAEADQTARFIAGCYAAFPRFDAFTAYSMFYFAAASFSEMARRVDAPARPRRFLCADSPTFGAAMERLSPAVTAATGGLAYAREVASAVECLNVAGLCEPAKRNWYPVDLEDSIRGAAKFGLAPEVVRESIARAMPT